MDSTADPDREPDESELVAAILDRPDSPDRCIVYPRGLPEHVRHGRWLAAENDAFVGIDAMR